MLSFGLRARYTSAFTPCKKSLITVLQVIWNKHIAHNVKHRGYVVCTLPYVYLSSVCIYIQQIQKRQNRRQRKLSVSVFAQDVLYVCTSDVYTLRYLVYSLQ